MEKTTFKHMGTKMAFAFSNILMNKVEKKILNKSLLNPFVWKRYLDDIFSPWNTNKAEIESFTEQANNHHSTTKYTAEISDKEITFLDTYTFKGERFKKEKILDVRTHFNQTETFQYTHFSSFHPQGFKKGFIKGEALGLLRTNSSKTKFEEKIENFKANLLMIGYPKALINTNPSEINVKNRKRNLVTLFLSYRD